MNLAELYVQIMGDRAPLDRTLAGVHRSLMGFSGVGLSAGQGISSGLAIGAGSIVGALGSLGVRAGAALSRGVVLGTAGIGYGLFKAINGASDLGETMSKVGVVFGDQANEVIGSADAMAKAFGVPKREFLDAASQFGLIAQGMGLAQSKAGEFSASMAKAAVDAASFYNVPISESLEKIRAGLTGESEPLKAFGIIMSEDAVKAQALAMGLVKSGQELTNSAKLAARTALIQKGLASATGDLERTQGSLSNQTRKFWGQLENLGDSIGTSLVPAFADLLVSVNTTMGGMQTSLTTGEGAFTGFIGGVRTGIETAGAVYRNFSDVVSLVGVNAAEMATNFVEGLQWLGETAGVVATYFFTHFSDAVEAVQTVFANLGTNVGMVLQEIYDYLASGFKDPIEIKFVPVLEGFDAVGKGLNIPELKFSNFDDKRQPFIDNMNKTEALAGERKAAEAQKLAEAGKPAGPTAGPEKGAKAEKEKPATHQDLMGFAKGLQESIFGKDHAKETAEATKRTAKATEQIAKQGKAGGNQMAVAAGPA